MRSHGRRGLRVILAVFLLLTTVLLRTDRGSWLGWCNNRLAVSLVHKCLAGERNPGAIQPLAANSPLHRRPSIGAIRLVGFDLLEEGQASEAASLLEGAAPLDPLAAFWLGEAYRRLGWHDKATNAWRHAGAASYFLALGHRHYAAMNYSAACRDYLLAVEIAPESAWAHMYAGHCYMRRGRFDLAERAYRIAIQLNPQYGYPYIHLATLLRTQLERPREAEEVLKRCMNATRTGEWYLECRQAIRNNSSSK